jgi:electron transfer flavoprotein alpha subunit
MSILVFADNKGGKVTRSSFEAVSYAAAVGGEVIAVTFGNISGDGGLGEYGASKVLVDSSISTADSSTLTALMEKAVAATGANVIVVSHDSTGMMVSPRLAARLNAGLVTGAVALPDASSGFVVKKKVFSGKAFANVEITSAVKIIGLLPNAFGLKPKGGTAAVESISTGAQSSVEVVGFEATSTDGSIPLPEAELVVSAGRGLKGPENWGMVEELARVLGAATACSRPVADIGWRPHHEHVGQTGVAIRPNLYIAIGISGAIQHLAGVNGSKVIVVINTDPEAPFFKAADYGILGDAFEVVPKLVEAAKAFKAQ